MTPVHVVRYLKVTHSCLHMLFKKTQDGIYIWGDECKNEMVRGKWYMESECIVSALKHTTVTYTTIFLDLQPIPQ